MITQELSKKTDINKQVQIICKKENQQKYNNWMDELYKNAEKYGRSSAVFMSSNHKAAYEELYGEHPWEFEPGEW